MRDNASGFRERIQVPRTTVGFQGLGMRYNASGFRERIQVPENGPRAHGVGFEGMGFRVGRGTLSLSSFWKGSSSMVCFVIGAARAWGA